MLNWLYSKLQKIKDKKKHEVLKLKWEKAELEAKLRELQEK